MSLRFILSIAFILACCLLFAQSFQPLSYKVKAQAKSYSTERLSNNNFRLYKPDSKVHGILFAQPDRKITRDSEDEYFEADVRKYHLCLSFNILTLIILNLFVL